MPSKMSSKALVKRRKNCNYILYLFLFNYYWSKSTSIYYLTCLNILRKDIWSKPKQEKKLIKKKEKRQSLSKPTKAGQSSNTHPETMLAQFLNLLQCSQNNRSECKQMHLSFLGFIRSIRTGWKDPNPTPLP